MLEPLVQKIMEIQDTIEEEDDDDDEQGQQQQQPQQSTTLRTAPVLLVPIPDVTICCRCMVHTLNC